MEKVFKTVFNSSQNNYSKIKFKKTSTIIDTKIDINSKPDEIYYDDVIIYDGGGVDGYGY